jgi:signal transduction histidine kinase
MSYYQGKPALLETVISITERKRAEAELLKSMKLETVGILAGGLAHDFNNLLAVIIGNLGLARNSVTNQSHKLEHYLEKAEKASIQASDLVQNFLTISEGGWVIKNKVTLHNILKDTRNSLPQIRNIPYAISIPGDLKPLYGDERQLRQVMMNLILNSHEATFEKGEDKSIRIKAENIILQGENEWSLEKGEYVKVSVIDNGMGISPDLLEKIFDPYFSTKERSNKKGTGMGLTICYAIIKKHEGHIVVYSTPGKGTTVDLYLPVYSSE